MNRHQHHEHLRQLAAKTDRWLGRVFRWAAWAFVLFCLGLWIYGAHKGFSPGCLIPQPSLF
jgi:hypothetical protein